MSTQVVSLMLLYWLLGSIAFFSLLTFLGRHTPLSAVASASRGKQTDGVRGPHVARGACAAHRLLTPVCTGLPLQSGALFYMSGCLKICVNRPTQRFPKTVTPKKFLLSKAVNTPHSGMQ